MGGQYLRLGSLCKTIFPAAIYLALGGPAPRDSSMGGDGPPGARVWCPRRHLVLCPRRRRPRVRSSSRGRGCIKVIRVEVTQGGVSK